ncbi:MAG: toprim domain-containing protein, partial [Streptococcaceae bacterium]|nr:toprim domain-containing protein [Streptococcaceae bacterium]
PEKPITIVVFEAPIDLMSYYEIFQHKLSNVHLVAMNGLKDKVISHVIADYLNPDMQQELKSKALEVVNRSENAGQHFKVVMAVDNDEAGKQFVANFAKKYPNIQMVNHLPKMLPNQSKTDWNDMLRQLKTKVKKEPNVFQERLQEISKLRSNTVVESVKKQSKSI